MALSIKILKKIGGRSDMIASRSWPQSRITIGRGEECTLVLEDPKKHVSRVHVELEEKSEGAYVLTVASKVNPVFINGKRLKGDHKLEEFQVAFGEKPAETDEKTGDSAAKTEEPPVPAE